MSFLTLSGIPLDIAEWSQDDDSPGSETRTVTGQIFKENTYERRQWSGTSKLLARSEADAIRSVYGAIHEGDPTPDLIAIKYLEALGAIADGQATKIFLPADLSATLGSLGAIAELFTGEAPDAGGESEAPPAPAEDPPQAD